MNRYAPGYGGIAYAIGFDAPVMSAPGAFNANIALPASPPISRPQTYTGETVAVTSAIQDQDVRAALDTVTGNPQVDTAGAPVPTASPASDAGGTIFMVAGILGIFYVVHRLLFK